MRLAVPTEIRPGESRVALVPREVGKLVHAGATVAVQAGAGELARFPDEAYVEAGATIAADPADLLASSDVVAKVQPPTLDEVALFGEGSALVSFLAPSIHLEVVRALAQRRVSAFSFELLPRISRAQAMDALSSQATIAGYYAVMVGASRLPRLFPLLMTAAGTAPPARVLVLGAGVAGLQAIATSRRLGAVVSAYDVRSAAAEEVRSLGATFVELPLEAQEGTGGYAAAQSTDFQARQQELIATHVAAADVVVTTAAIPGRPAPRLVTAAMVESMPPGSVIVDLAAASGGNCEVTRVDTEVVHQGVTVVGARDLATSVPTQASAFYARNMANLLLLMVAGGQFHPDYADEIVAGTCVTADGQVRHLPTRELLEKAFS